MPKHALLIGVDDYPALPGAPVPAAGADIEALAAALRNRSRGGFASVTLLRNPDRAGLLRALDRLFTARHRDDLVLLYLAGIAVADPDRRLVLLPADARGLDQPGDGVPAAMIRSRMDLSDSREQVLILDLAIAAPAGADQTIVDAWTFGGPSRAVWVSAPGVPPDVAAGSPATPRPGFTAALAQVLAGADPDDGAPAAGLLGLREAVDRALGAPRQGPVLWLGHPRLGALAIGGARPDPDPATPPRAVSVTTTEPPPEPWDVPLERRGRRWLRVAPIAVAALLSTSSGIVMLAISDWSVQGVAARMSAGVAVVAADLRGLTGAGEPRALRTRLHDGRPGPPLQALPGGFFVMGSPDLEPERAPVEGPEHTVAITSFAIGVNEVSFAEYDRFARAVGKPLPPDGGEGRGPRPVVNVTWHEASAYAAWLGAQMNRTCRLPSEAEWEYAARAGRSTPFTTGQCIDTTQANYNGRYDYAACGARTGVYRKEALPVGTLAANRFGLRDLHGNVAEWVADCWHENYRGAPNDGRAWLRQDDGDCGRRVVRGGDWRYKPGFVRSAARLWDKPEARSPTTGFRIVCDL